MIGELERLTSLGDEMQRRARAASVLMISRAQTRLLRSVQVRRGRPEATSASSSSGHGVQVVTASGRTAMGSRDDFRPEAALALLSRVIEVAERGDRLGVTPGKLCGLQALRERRVAHREGALERIDLGEVGRRLVELESEILAAAPGVQLQVTYRAEVDAWRIRRSDDTDVLFSIPRCTLSARATGSGDTRHGVSTAVFGTQPELPWDEERLRVFVKRAVQSAQLARSLPDAPHHPAGRSPLVIDYALAKGLAHEAFGHAAEADGYRSSILARDGRFRAGETVGAEHVSIIDEPIEDDHAWQPYSSNGVRRERATLVDHGRLAEGLSDIWSADAGGVRLTGAARVESFHDAPQPRMTNIRIEVDDPLPAAGAFEDYGPQQVRSLLEAVGVFDRHPRVAFLSGYSGGQVNTTTGDFVFNCKAIYSLDRRSAVLHKPAILSGSMFGALHSIREAFGPLKLDALGYCGKWGQSVPSSGGSHYFLVLEPHDQVSLGGS